MNLLLQLAFLFFIGSVIGWVIEVFFRRFFSSANPERKWINPGFCTGPYLPLYGTGLCVLYLVASLEKYSIFGNQVADKILLFVIMTVLMTVIEYIAGIWALKVDHIRLWDYSNQWGNIQGLICPKFSLCWGLLGAVYYFLVHPHIKQALEWLGRNLAFSFFIGVFFGIFIIDFAHSKQIVSKLRKFARDNDLVIRYEHLKSNIRAYCTQTAGKYHFFRPFTSDRPITEHLKGLRDAFEKVKAKKKQ